ncbi:hypothetical protein [Mycoplasma seminis]|uniref:Lipoprotein n=1 Tax=Mycoplasma seminis TaxID=512749 RepID=A0ABY9HBF5_9MOLU|nr:hypothetical protein [Mycoplasma seminis]WLP85776.1 hypothetical protein Q8852_01335 [Mycoplasma seminis]
MKKINKVILALALGASSLPIALSVSCQTQSESTSKLASERDFKAALIARDLRDIQRLSSDDYANFNSQLQVIKSKDADNLTKQDIKTLSDLATAVADKLSTLSSGDNHRKQDLINKKMKEVALLKQNVDILKDEVSKLGGNPDDLLVKDIDSIIPGEGDDNIDSSVSSAQLEKVKEKLRQQIALLEYQKANLEFIKSKYVKRAPSAIEAIRLVQSLNRYIIDTIRVKYKDRYESNKDLINNQATMIETHLKEVNDIELSYTNSNRVYNVLREAMNFSSLIQGFIIPDGKNVTDIEIPFKKSDAIEELFEWRIKDLEKLLEALKSQDTNETYKAKTIAEYKTLGQETLKEKAKEMKIENFETKSVEELATEIYTLVKAAQKDLVQKILDTYKMAKTEGKNLTDQITRYIFLDQKAWSKHIQNPSTPDEFFPSFGVGFKVSTFPLLNQIIDLEALKEFDAIVKKVQGDYKVFFQKNAGYLTSIKYEKFYDEYKKQLVDIVRYNLIQDIFTKKGIAGYLYSLKDQLSNFEIRDIEKESQQLNTRITELKRKTDLLFNSKIRNKWNEILEDGKDNKTIGKTYRMLFTYFNRAKVNAARNLNVKNPTIADLFDKLLEYEKLNDELNSAVFLLEYFKGLGINQSDEKITKYLNLDALAEKYNNKIEENEKYIEKLTPKTQAIEKLAEQFANIKVNDLTDANAMEQNKTNIDLLDKFIKSINDQKVIAEGYEKDRKFYFGYPEEAIDGKYKFNELIDKGVLKAENLLKELQEIKEKTPAEILEAYKKVKAEYEAIKLDIFGPAGTENDEIYESKSLLEVINNEIENQQDQISQFRRKASEIKKSAFIIPLNEVQILLRQGDLVNSKFYLDNSISETHPDKYAYEVTVLALKQLREKNPLFRRITNTNSSLISSHEEKPEFNANDTYKELLKIEKNYYEANIEYMQAKINNSDSIDSVKEKLAKARDKYYEFITNPKLEIQPELKPKAVYTFSSGDDSQEDPEAFLNPGNLILNFAKAHSLKTLMQLISDEKVK